MNMTRNDMPSVDAEHPWIGLASFSESSRGYFHGRDDEITELCRRIQRKPLTVLFGKSGLGKTSILQAGVVPRLRGQGYCPVYLRIDYAESAPSASEQIKQAIVKAAEQSGRWTRAGVADEGESLWAFLHHRDDVLLDADGRPLLPLLIFDQFEEIFTLAQADEQGRERAAAFRADLADLVENRPPAALEALLESDDSAYERYDLTRSDYRVVISLREDYLAHLEGLKAAMPSITQNRLRLAPMTGAQALAAVIEPGRHLVNDEVAASIVRFVAGGAEVSHAEVEPSLLSLICRELNDQRIALGRPEIGADLLAGSHTGILGEFYERSIADQPPGVRTFIENHLLTDSGYRENVAEERVRHEFAAAGALPDALALLVNRRLLRIEERLDLRRVELTHDVLCAVVRASRDARREREALEASERLTAGQAERARLAQRALKRARVVASVCILLAVGAVAASGFAVVSSRRAEQAQRDAQATRLRAEQLLSYLQDDFATQLVPLGRLDLVRSLNDRVVAYFDGVPKDQHTPEWEHARALALLAQAETLVAQGQSLVDAKTLNEALNVLDARVAQGHRSEADLAELGRALTTKAEWLIWGKIDQEKALTTVNRAAGLLTEATASGHPSVTTRMIQARISEHICYLQSVFSPSAAVASCETARRQYAALGGADVSNPLASEGFVYSSWSSMWALLRQHRADEALVIGEAAMKVGDAVVAKYPAYSRARWYRALVSEAFGEVYEDRLDLATAAMHYVEAETALAILTRTDSSVANLWNDSAYMHLQHGGVALQLGQPDVAEEQFNAALDIVRAGPSATFTLNMGISAAEQLGLVESDLGNAKAVKAALAQRQALESAMRRLISTASPTDIALQKCNDAFQEAFLAEASNDPAAARQLASSGLTAIDLSRADPTQTICHIGFWRILGTAQYQTGDAAGAEVALRQALQVKGRTPDRTTDDFRWTARVSTWLALAQIRQGQLVEARATLVPVLKLHRDLAKLGAQSATQRLEMAAALYAQALAEDTPAGRRRFLAQASALVDGLPPAMRTLHSFQRWRGWINSARNGTDTWPPKDAGRD